MGNRTAAEERRWSQAEYESTDWLLTSSLKDQIGIHSLGNCRGISSCDSHCTFDESLSVLIENHGSFTFIQFLKSAVFSGQDFHKVLLLSLQAEDREVCSEEHFVTDSQGHDVLDCARRRIIAKGGLIATDVKVNIGPESAQHHAFLNKADCPVRQNKVDCWEQTRRFINQERTGDAKVQDGRCRPDVKQDRHMMKSTQLIKREQGRITGTEAARWIDLKTTKSKLD